jgi:tetratricopeptide (TPR) repeat protein
MAKTPDPQRPDETATLKKAGEIIVILSGIVIAANSVYKAARGDRQFMLFLFIGAAVLCWCGMVYVWLAKIEEKSQITDLVQKVPRFTNKRLRLLAMIGSIVIPVAGLIYSILPAPSNTRVAIVLTKFGDPDPKRLTDRINSEMEAFANAYESEMRFTYVPEVVETSERAKAIRKEKGAAVVLWGSYDEDLCVTYHFEVEEERAKELPLRPVAKSVNKVAMQDMTATPKLVSLLAIGVGHYQQQGGLTEDKRDYSRSLFILNHVLQQLDEVAGLGEVKEVALLYRGLCNLKAGTCDQARQDFKAIFERERAPSAECGLSNIGMPALRKIDLAASINLAAALLDCGQAFEAASHLGDLEQELRAQITDPNVKDLIWAIWYNFGITTYELGLQADRMGRIDFYERAIIICRQALDMCSSVEGDELKKEACAQTHLLTGAALYAHAASTGNRERSLGSLEQARNHYEAARAVYDERPEYEMWRFLKVNLAYVKAEKGRLKKEKSLIKEALKELEEVAPYYEQKSKAEYDRIRHGAAYYEIELALLSESQDAVHNLDKAIGRLSALSPKCSDKNDPLCREIDRDLDRARRERERIMSAQ